MARELRLTQETYICLSDGRLVIANLRRDKYSCLTEANTQLFLRLFPSLAKGNTNESMGLPADKRAADRVVAALCRHELLVNEPRAGKPVEVIDIPQVVRSRSSMASGDHHVRPSADLVRFFGAAAVASIKLKMLPLSRMVRGIEARRIGARKNASQDLISMVRLATTFQQLRPLYPRKYLCRFDSLALLEFLALHHCYPQWVFGVRGEPFGAHCWVQEGDCVLNDSVEYVNRFTPIMAF